MIACSYYIVSDYQMIVGIIACCQRIIAAVIVSGSKPPLHNIIINKAPISVTASNATTDSGEMLPDTFMMFLTGFAITVSVFQHSVDF